MRLNRLDLNQLQVLDAMLSERSTTRVAEQFGLSQPAVSGILRRLREYFDDPLFVQTRRRLQPTAFALEMAGPVRDMLLKAEVVSRMRPSTDLARLKRTIRIAASDFVAVVRLAPIFRALSIEAPHLRFDLHTTMDSRPTYHEDLDRGEVDLLIIPQVFASAEHPAEVVLQEDFVCVACADSRWRPGTLDLEAYLDAGHVTLANRIGVAPPYMDLEIARLGYVRRIEVSGPFLVIPSMLVGTDRLATVPESLATYLQRHWPLTVLPCPAPIAPMVEVVQWHTYNAYDPAIALLRDRIVGLGASAPPAAD